MDDGWTGDALSTPSAMRQRQEGKPQALGQARPMRELSVVGKRNMMSASASAAPAYSKAPCTSGKQYGISRLL